MGTGGLRGKWELTYANATVSATCLLNCRKEKEFDDSDASSFKVQQCHVDRFFLYWASKLGFFCVQLSRAFNAP